MHIQQKYIVHSSGGREAPNPDTEIEVSWKVPPWILHCALLGASRGRRGGWGLGEPSGMASLQRLLSRQLDDMSWYGYWRDRVLQAGETVKAVCNISVARVRERSEGDTETRPIREQLRRRCWARGSDDRMETLNLKDTGLGCWGGKALIVLR